MVMLPRWLRVPRPRAFLYLMSLRTGTEMIALSMIFNKVTGFYGLLAILTGLQLSPLQLSMYIYSVVALVILAFLMPHIRKQSPLQSLALAWFYLLDTIVSTAFTAAFAGTWFLAVSADSSNSTIPGYAPGSGTINDAAGFTKVNNSASNEDTLINPITRATSAQETVAHAAVVATGAATATPSFGHGVGIEESIPSIVVVVALTIVRVYFIFVVMAYARQVLRQHLYSMSSPKLHFHTDGATDAPAGNPFATGSPAGQGWGGKLGRLMLKIGEGYWLGDQADDSWAKGMDGRFRTTKKTGGPPGTVERERRARSGTGPPLPSLDVVKT